MLELSVKNLHVFRGERHLFRGLAFAVPAQRCLQVTGANGAGKTTLLRVLAGLLEPESLELRWRDRELSPRDAEYHGELSYLGHDAALKADLTGIENIRFSVGLRRALEPEALRVAIARVAAQKFADRLVRTLSAGQRRRIALASLLLSDTRLWLLDEPSTNLDTAGQALIGELIAAQLARGGTVITATHQDLGLAAGARIALELGSSA
jgi:heme exporter protein A